MELNTVAGVETCAVKIDNTPMGLHSASRMLTRTIQEAGRGLFESGEIEYVRADNAKKTFSQPERLCECTESVLRERILAVRAWVHGDDRAFVVEFEV